MAPSFLERSVRCNGDFFFFFEMLAVISFQLLFFASTLQARVQKDPPATPMKTPRAKGDKSGDNAIGR